MTGDDDRRTRDADDRRRPDADQTDAQSNGDQAAAATDTEREHPDRPDDHLAGVEPGAGCTEIWEYLSEQRANGEE